MTNDHAELSSKLGAYSIFPAQAIADFDVFHAIVIDPEVPRSRNPKRTGINLKQALQKAIGDDGTTYSDTEKASLRRFHDVLSGEVKVVKDFDAQELVVTETLVAKSNFEIAAGSHAVKASGKVDTSKVRSMRLEELEYREYSSAEISMNVTREWKAVAKLLNENGIVTHFTSTGKRHLIGFICLQAVGRLTATIDKRKTVALGGSVAGPGVRAGITTSHETGRTLADSQHQPSTDGDAEERSTRKTVLGVHFICYRLQVTDDMWNLSEGIAVTNIEEFLKSFSSGRGSPGVSQESRSCNTRQRNRGGIVWQLRRAKLGF